MVTVRIDPILLAVGPFVLRWYSMIILTAVVVGASLVIREAERRGFKKDDIYDSLIWILLAGIVGARLFHVLDHWPMFALQHMRILYIWEGGLAIWGAVAGGLLATAILAWRKGWHLARFLDAAAPGVVLGQAIGRIACVITGDAMGKPTSGPFGFAYTSPNALVPQLGVYYTPMPVYELVGNLVIFFVLWKLRKKHWPDGLLFLAYLILYSLERFFLAYTSSYQVMLLGLTQSQVVALISLIVAVPITVHLLKRRSLLPSSG